MLYDPNWKPKIDVVDEVEDLMLRAADYLETHRWGQCELLSRNGAVCMVGSLIRVENNNLSISTLELDRYDHPLSSKAYIRLEKYFGKHWIPECWNDADKRKKSEVVTALREAAKLK